MKRIVLFIIFVVNLQIICNKEAFDVQFGFFANAQHMTYEALGQECEGDSNSAPNTNFGDNYWSSLPCDFDGGISADEGMTTDDWLNALGIPMSVIGIESDLIEASAKSDMTTAIGEALKTSSKIANVAKCIGGATALFSVGSTVYGLVEGDNPTWVDALNIVGATAGIVGIFYSAPIITATSVVCTVIAITLGP